MIEPKIREQIKRQKWYKIYAGNWSILTLSYWAEGYTDAFDFEGRTFVQSCALVYKHGACSGFVPEVEKENFTQYMAERYSANPGKIESFIPYFKNQADNILEWMAAQQNQTLTLEFYQEFLRRINVYYIPHIINKWMVESLSPELLQKYLPGLEEARLHVESVFKRTEELTELMAEQIAAKVAYTREDILSLTKNELLAYWQGGNLPDAAVLKERYQSWVVVHLPGLRTTYQGPEVADIESWLTPPTAAQDAATLKGIVAYPGKVTGTVKIILDPSRADHFQTGDILVAGMTRPEYLLLMKKAGAFITDSGGVLSHAAIVARELKKPCVIGTQIATKVLKDGDIVEVDAEQGVVRIIK